MATSTDLRAAIEEVQGQLPDEHLEAEGVQVFEADMATRIERRVGTLPWWMISAIVHTVLFLLATLLSVAMPPPQVDEVTISTDMVKREEPKYDEKKQRDIFKRQNEIQDKTQVEKPVLLHEEVEVTDHFETDNDMDKKTARGSEDAISDIPLGGFGPSGSIGVGGGGMAGVFGYRSGGGRKKAIARFGGSPATESAVEAALRWLARHQEADGHWDVKKHEGGARQAGTRLSHDEAVTALGVLAFLGAGYTHKVGKYQDNVKRGLKWLVSKQLASGAFSREGCGSPGRNDGFEIYDHAIGSLALAEAYGMTRDPALRTPAQKGIDNLIKLRVPYKGWRHGKWHSTSVLGWVVMALKSAKVSGLRVDGAGFQGAANKLDAVTDPKSGKVGYSRRGQYMFTRGFTMTSVGMVCRQFMGVGNNDPVLRKQADLLLTQPPVWKKVGTGEPQFFYHWYYGTLAMFQMGGDRWKKWNTALKPSLLNNQRRGGDEDGSWDPESGWAPTGGRVYTTALGALTLEVYYRYLPMYSK